ncbi:MAG: tetratricopeptide repeat protein [Steroidobacteraceae bacterium]|uniref:tetratricopeptide repeat protein n=1 Tax=Thauera sp. TaxID=1905334 RepID=UPI001B71AAEF|nr:tetratricopeptide repeat protein [Thauera sp.]MBP7015206.1 tetratricopeptide repeat protein [Steroidobacteraceae bacterium]MBP7049106.1 tetratricopeptide repeat protein [Thauera sp.]
MTSTGKIRHTIAGLLLTTLLALVAGCGGAEARKERYLARGQELMAARNYEKARLEFRNAIQIDPKDATARVRAGEAAERLGNYTEAAQMYQSAVAADEKNALARARLGRMLALAGLPDRALEIIAPALVTAPDDAELLTVRAAATMLKGDLAAARTDAERAVQLDPASEEAVAVLAALLRRAGEGREAVALVSKAVEAAPKSVDLRLVLAQLLVDQQRNADAQQQLEEIIRLEPDNLVHRYRLAQLHLFSKNVDGAEATLRQAVAANPDSVEAQLALASLLAAQRSFEAADKELIAARRKEPDNLPLLVGIGEFYDRAGQPAKAETVYREVIDKDGTGPQGLTARNRIAMAQLRARKPDEARKLVEEVLAENPRDADALVMRADLALAKGDTNGAVTDLRAVLRDQPNSVPIRRALARAHLQAGDTALAEEALRAAVQASPRDLLARLDLAQLLLQQGKPEAALPVIEQLVKDEPNNVAALEALYRVQAGAKDLDAALKTANAIQALQPKLPLGYYLAGLVQQGQQKSAEASESFSAAVALAPTDWQAYRGQAAAELARGNVDAAISVFRQGIAATKGAAPLVIDLATLLEQQGRPEEAIAEYEAMLAANPTSEIAANNLAMLLATYRKDDKSLARAEELAGRFAKSPNPAFLDTWGWVLYSRGKYAAAVPVLADAVKKAPEAQVLQYHLGMAQLQAGDRSAARASLELAVKGDARYPGIEEARAALAKLK